MGKFQETLEVGLTCGKTVKWVKGGKEGGRKPGKTQIELGRPNTVMSTWLKAS